MLGRVAQTPPDPENESIAAYSIFHLFQNLVNAEAGRLHVRRKLLESRQKFAHNKLGVKRISCGYVPGTGLRCFGRAENDQPVPGT